MVDLNSHRVCPCFLLSSIRMDQGDEMTGRAGELLNREKTNTRL